MERSRWIRGPPQPPARRLPLETRCLHIALAGAIILHRRRIQATVVLGVRSKDGLLKAHVWLLSAGAWRFGGSCPYRGSGVSVLQRATGLRLRPPTGPPSAFC
ncbi:MAG: lasso peptide biosynthesis B2 protein [Elstera sp.]